MRFPVRNPKASSTCVQIADYPEWYPFCLAIGSDQSCSMTLWRRRRERSTRALHFLGRCLGFWLFVPKPQGNGKRRNNAKPRGLADSGAPYGHGGTDFIWGTQYLSRAGEAHLLWRVQGYHYLSNEHVLPCNPANLNHPMRCSGSSSSSPG